MTKRKKTSFLGKIFHYLLVGLGAAALALAFFLILPLMQTISKPSEDNMVVQTVDTGQLEPPPPVEEEEPPEEPEEQEEPPELSEEAQRLELSQIELALNQGLGGGVGSIDSSVKLMLKSATSGNDSNGLYSLSELDQRPRIVHQPGPRITSGVRKKAPGKVYIIFIVNKNGRVENPVVQKSSNAVFEQPALAAVKKWKFEPGKRAGKPVRFRMRVPIIFPEGL